jgi:hypothetical protein
MFLLPSPLRFKSSTTRKRKGRLKGRERRTLFQPQWNQCSLAVRAHMTIQKGKNFAGCAGRLCRSVAALSTPLSSPLAPGPPADITAPWTQLGRCQKGNFRFSPWNPSLFPIVIDSTSVLYWRSFSRSCSRSWVTGHGVAQKLLRAQLRSFRPQTRPQLRQQPRRSSSERRGAPCRKAIRLLPRF